MNQYNLTNIAWGLKNKLSNLLNRKGTVKELDFWLLEEISLSLCNHIIRQFLSKY
ncbi:hypothetical protein H1P_1270012 [Hyella patelloides LEGE 07179]|uniref:Uncharacterized protein n=1 Tax=Hyella patelloides LEGE 07179 TaxID=945734 RepID=A0A563VKR6_9CYAN|nr:hypothetical protein [Hyella patelloides]VEP11937.1 hypothetical protein H1P_1270012 [Hyella patelloides LEGE 07179]